MNNNQPKLIIFTDGAFSRKTNTGGWAFIAQYQIWNQECELYQLIKEKCNSGTVSNTTSNRMELVGCIEGLKYLKRPCNVEIYSDSTYVVNTINKWLQDFVTQKDRLNLDLMIDLYSIVKYHKSVKATWVRGHADCLEHNRVDVLAQKAAGTYKGKD